MVSSAFSAMQAIHGQLSDRGFFSQFVGSMIQYRHPQKPELSLGLSVDENPWRPAGKHGEFRYQLTNTTFVPNSALQEEAQSLLNELMQNGLQLRGDFDFAELRGVIAPDAMRTMQAACKHGQNMHDAFKSYLKAIHDVLKENTESISRTEKRGELKKQKLANATQKQKNLAAIQKPKSPSLQPKIRK